MLTIEIFIHRTYSRAGHLLDQYYEGVLFFDNVKEKRLERLGEADGQTEREVSDGLTDWANEIYFPMTGKKQKIKVLK